MIKAIFSLLLLAIGGMLFLAFRKPDSFRIERSITIKASPETVATNINDFHQWTHWSPWENIDPTMKRSYSGAASGTGAHYAWESTGKAGVGRMEVLDVTPQKTTIKLDFMKPFEAHNTAEFTYKPTGDGTTQVVWAMFGPANLISKVMGVFFNMDTMVGKDFEAGLLNLKAASEKHATTLLK